MKPRYDSTVGLQWRPGGVAYVQEYIDAYAGCRHQNRLGRIAVIDYILDTKLAISEVLGQRSGLVYIPIQLVVA